MTFGPTGRFPYGKLNDSDEGEVAMGIVADPFNGVVRLDFGKPVAWLGLPSVVARELARMLVEKADEVDRLTM
jgi:hypothetical protein